jgi:hypothetical protein
MAQHRAGRPIFWPQNMLERGADAVRECRSNDCITIARAVLEATIRGVDDINELARPPAAPIAIRKPDARLRAYAGKEQPEDLATD